MLRFLVALLAWPAGVIAGFVLLIILSPSCPAGQQVCALEPNPPWQTLLVLLVVVTPGFAATVWWWRGRQPSA